MNHYKYSLITVLILLSACSVKPIEPRPGMALIDTYNRYEDENNKYLSAKGFIDSVIRSDNAEKIEDNSLLFYIHTYPGKYIVKYHCEIEGDYRQYGSQRFYKEISPKTEEIKLKEGDKLKVFTMVEHRTIIGPGGESIIVPFCESSLQIDSIYNKKEKKYL